jgi:hypothetical protein
MGARANLLTAAIDVQPGDEATSSVQVRNAGNVVDEFRFEVVGLDPTWAKVEPEVLPLFPGDEGTVIVHVTPPRLPTTPVGHLPFGVKVVSREDPESTVVEEGTLNIGPFSEISAELVPRSSRGRWGATHDLAVDNRGNTTYEAALSANEPNGLLRTTVKPPSISAPPGSAVFAKVQLQPVKRFFRGHPKTHPFQAQVEHEGADPITLDGTMVQEALLPAWTLKALAGLVALALLGLILWLTLVKPQIKSAAKDQVNHQLTAAGISVPASTSPSSAASGGNKAGGAKSGGASGSSSAGGGAAAGTGTAGAAVSGASIDGRLSITGNGTANYQVPAGHVLQLTDIVLENPNGDPGTLVIARSGTVLLQLSMANFRDLDYHFVSPVIFPAGSSLQLITSGCTTACSPGVYYSGYLPVT